MAPLLINQIMHGYNFLTSMFTVSCLIEILQQKKRGGSFGVQTNQSSRNPWWGFIYPLDIWGFITIFKLTSIFKKKDDQHNVQFTVHSSLHMKNMYCRLKVLNLMSKQATVYSSNMTKLRATSKKQIFKKVLGSTRMLRYKARRNITNVFGHFGILKFSVLGTQSVLLKHLLSDTDVFKINIYCPAKGDSTFTCIHSLT